MAKDEQTMVAILTEIVRIYGASVFKERRKVYALLSDMAPGEGRVKERRRMKAVLESGAVDILLKAIEDKAGCEFYINEAIARLISKTDMAEEIAREVILFVAEALSLAISHPTTELNDRKVSKAPKPDTTFPAGSASDADKRSSNVGEKQKKRNRKKAVLLSVGIAVSIFIVVTLFAGIFFAPVPLKYWLSGIASGFILTGITIGIAYVFQEYILFNEMCQTITIVIPILFAVNIVLRIVLGDEAYALIFQIISVFMVAGSIANAISTRVVWEEKWTWPNILMAVCSSFLFFIWPGHFSWTVWQWIIGIGGGLLLSAIVFAVIDILDMIGPEMFISLSVILLFLTIVNVILLVTIGENYLIIAECYTVLLALGALIGVVMCYNEAATGLQVLNSILLLINGGAFLFLIFGSYEYFLNVIQTVFDKMCFV